MTRGRRAMWLRAWSCVPVVLVACGEESDARPAGPDNSRPASSLPTTAPPDSLPTSPPKAEPEATMPTIDRPSTPEPPTGTTANASTIAPGVSPGTSGNIDVAVADLQARVGAEVPIEVISREEVTWPNGGLGCPQPDMNYTQALVNGERIVLRANDVEYEYHSGKNQPAFYCPPERVTPPVTGSYGNA